MIYVLQHLSGGKSIKTISRWLLGRMYGYSAPTKIWIGAKEDLKELFLVSNFLSFFLPVILLEVSNKHDAKGIGSTSLYFGDQRETRKCHALFLS